MDEEIKTWGFWVVILGWATTVGKFIQVITQQGKIIEKLNSDNDDKSAVLLKLSERSESMERYIKKLESQNENFENAMNQTALAINTINGNVTHLTDLTERNIALNNKRVEALEKKTQEYDERIRDFYETYDLKKK